MYNLVSIVQSDRFELGNIQQLIGLLSSDISKNFKDGFTTKRTHNDTGEDEAGSAKRSRRSHRDQRGNGNGLQHGEHVYDDRQVVDAFTRAGYKLESNDENENGWEPLNKVKRPSTLTVDVDLN
jgi:hypothetical protein